MSNIPTAPIITHFFTIVQMFAEMFFRQITRMASENEILPSRM